MAKSCRITTHEDRLMAVNLGMSTAATTNLVGLYQERNNTDEYPSLEQLQGFKDVIRAEDEVKLNNILERHLSTEQQHRRSPLGQLYDATTRRARVGLISQWFSDNIDDALDQHVDILQKQLDSAETEQERINAKRNLDNINRDEVIKMVRPFDVLDSVRDSMQELVNDDQSDLDDYQRDEIQKVVDNFEYFLPEVAQQIAITENILLRPDSVDSFTIDLTDTDNDGNSYSETEGDQMSKEEEYKDHWQEDVRFMNPITSLSREVRNVLRNIKLLDAKTGERQLDDLGLYKYVDSNLAHAVLIKELSNMSEPEHMIPMLEKLANKHGWVSQVIEELEKPENESLFSKFYNDFRKDFQEFWILTSETLPNGKVVFKTVSLNRKNDPSQTLKDWQSDIENRTKFNDSAIYNNDGSLSQENATQALSLVRKLEEKTFNLPVADKIELLNNGNFLTSLAAVINRAGINVGPIVVKDALSNSADEKIIDPVADLLNALGIIYQGVSNRGGKADNLTTDYGTQYRRLAKLLVSGEESDIVSAVRESDKTRYAHIVPSYFGKLVKNLKATYGQQAFQEYIQKEYGQYDWFKDQRTGEWNNLWIELLESDKDVRDRFNYHTLLNANTGGGKKEYVDWTPRDNAINDIQEFFVDGKNSKSSKPFANYRMPILADSQAAEYITFRRFTNSSGGIDAAGNAITFEDQILDGLERLVRQEYNRIKLVTAREDQIRAGKIGAVENYDIVRKKDGSIDRNKSRGLRFNFIPQLNTLKGNNGKLFIEELEFVLNTNGDASALIRGTLRSVVNKEFQKAVDQYDEAGLFELTNGGELKWLDVEGKKEDALPMLKEFFWNNYLAKSQIIQLTTTDLAFYKHYDDFQKRYKQTEAKANKLNTTSKHGKKIERTIYLKDQYMVSNMISEIEAALQKRVDDGTLTKHEKGIILEKYQGINVTDAQAFRSLDSYRSIRDMAGDWSEAQERLFNNLKSNKWSYSDYGTFFQPIKPFVYTQGAVNSGVEGKTAMKVPVQHKNSEYLLLAGYETIVGPLSTSPKLRALSNFMRDNDIDVVQFESAVKVGKQGVVDINDLTTEEDVYNRLTESIARPDVLHTIDYGDYGIQVELPQHTLDSQILFGTQLRALVFADLPSGYEFKIGELTYTKEQLWDIYNDLITENYSVAAQNIEDIFSNPLRLNQKAMDEVRGNPRYPADFLEALKLDKTGNPILPYYEVVNGRRVQSLFHSMMKNEVIKQKIKGGAYIQLTGYGLTDELNIRYNEDGSLNSWEVYMPWWSKNLFKDFMDPKTGELNIDKIPENLREAIGFRIPTENKYSMPPLFIKGFLPQSTGDAIMLPADVTTSLGADFDIDKLYVLLPESYRTGDGVVKVEYDYSKPASEQSLAARNNALIDVTRSVLTSQVSTGLSTVPGNFDKVKSAASVVTLARNKTIKEIAQLINVKEDKVFETLMKMNTDTLVGLANTVKEELSPLSSVTDTILHERNMTGAKMIGIFANNNKHQALMQHTSLTLNPESIVTINGKRLGGLNNSKNPSGKGYISETLAGYLAASVDNGKDPQMGYMNINGFTVNSVNLLARLGYSELEIALFMSQPAILEVTRDFNNGNRNAVEDYIKDNLAAIGVKNIKEAENKLMNTRSWGIEDMFNSIQNKDKDVLAVVQLNKIIKASKDLQRVTGIKLDNGDGSIGPSIGESIVNAKTIEDILWDAQYNKNFSLSGVTYLTPEMNESLAVEQKGVAMRAPVPYIQMAYSAGVGSVKKNMTPYYYQYNETSKQLVDGLIDRASASKLDARLINQMFEEYALFKATGHSFFGQDGIVATAEKRRQMLETFPEFLNKVVASDPNVADLPLMKKLAVRRSKGSKFMSIQMTNANHLTSAQKDNLMTDWTQLIYSTNPEARKLGVGLFLYSSIKGGFGFGPSSFMSLASTDVKLNIPQYKEIMDSLMKNDKSVVDSFLDQFVRNHMYEHKLVQSIDRKEAINAFKTDELNYFSSEFIKENMPEIIKEYMPEDIVPKTYVSIYKNGKLMYFQNVGYENNMHVYERVMPLGEKNSLLEYDYNRTGRSVESVIDENNLHTEDEVNSENNDYIEAEDLFDEQPVEVDTTASIVDDSVEDSVLTKIFGTSNVPGEDNNMPNRRKSILEYPYNPNWKDKDGNKIC
jgi:hypothetical protein